MTQMNSKLVIFFISILLFIACKHNNIIPNNGIYYDGKMVATKSVIKNSIDTLATYYYESGGIKCIESYSNRKPNGVSCFFSENGELQSVEYFINGKLENYTVNFIDSNKIRNICRYHNGGRFASAYIPFSSNNVIAENPNSDIIIKGQSSPFVTVDALDTIQLGWAYSAKIIYNFPLKRFDCSIYSIDTAGKWHTLVKNDQECTYSEMPKTIGVHLYKIYILQTRPSPFIKDSLERFGVSFSVKYFVKSN